VAALGPPRALAPDDDRDAFDCGQEALNRWFRRNAWRNERYGTSRTYVVPGDSPAAVAGYVSLAVGQIERGLLTKPDQRNKPDPIPILLLGQLAVDLKHQGDGVGAGLLAHALSVAVAASRAVGVFAVLTHPISADARAYYRHWGFRDLPADPSGAMLVRIRDLAVSGF